MKYKLIFKIPFLFLFLSCASIKFKEIEMDYTQDLIGKIKEIKAIKFTYSFKFKDSIKNKQNFILFYDTKNNLIKQVEIYPKHIVETNYSYNNAGLLESKITKYENSILKSEYKYDKNKNCIQYNDFENDSLLYYISTKFDVKNNPLERNSISLKNKNNNCIEFFNNDYKNKLVTTTLKCNDGSNSIYRYSYDKKGKIIKTQVLNSNLKNDNSNFTEMEYDKFGNLTKSKTFQNNKVINEYTNKNTYDKKGNIICRETFSKDKLVEKVVYEIYYY